MGGSIEGTDVLKREQIGHRSSSKANWAHRTTNQRFWSKWHTKDILPVSRETAEELQIGIIITASLLLHHSTVSYLRAETIIFSFCENQLHMSDKRQVEKESNENESVR